MHRFTFRRLVVVEASALKLVGLKPKRARVRLVGFDMTCRDPLWVPLRPRTLLVLDGHILEAWVIRWI